MKRYEKIARDLIISSSVCLGIAGVMIVVSIFVGLSWMGV